ncbi:hypothetical protein QBC46DRAFT_20188 [Diplogelasinospora grovesii]|uniref:Zn(2)-C6 fungal-type domain-containing protein n=1 Tax=Diplogelasinospora grovesii TaxID=303347 RepID=A0AAN6N2B4_9PEZI|nr:hypothetical protein QBC46DRAFT_20188 [Diplogelasinospora grovesii]
MPPRRSHKKSRTGCRRCKVRKIKCDEDHPRCRNCEKHGVPCDYENPGVIGELEQTLALATPGRSHSASPLSVTAVCRSPSAPVLSVVTPASQRMLELRLMHQYTAATYKTISITTQTLDVWQNAIPRIAVAGPQHLANALLAVAALHLRSFSPDDRILTQASHAYIGAALADYKNELSKGIDQSNAEGLFLTCSLVTLHSVALRALARDELSIDWENGIVPADYRDSGTAAKGYTPPLSWFYALQGVKVVTASSWRYLRGNPVVTQIMNSLDGLQLDFTIGHGFFDKLLVGLENELPVPYINKPNIRAGGPNHPFSTPADFSQSEALATSLPFTAATTSSSSPTDCRPPPLRSEQGAYPPRTSSSGQSQDEESHRRHIQGVFTSRIGTPQEAYRHAIAVLNWAHKIPHKGSSLAFPATVSRHFVQLLEDGQPRAFAILACFFALLKPFENAWWLKGMVRREVVGIVELFRSGHFGPAMYDAWWPYLRWAEKISLWPEKADGSVIIPPDEWGVDWAVEEKALAKGGVGKDFVSCYEELSLSDNGSGNGNGNDDRMEAGLLADKVSEKGFTPIDEGYGD